MFKVSESDVKALEKRYEALTKSLQRSVLRKALRAGGTSLAANIRRELRNRLSGKATSIKRVAVSWKYKKPHTPLAKTIKVRTWSARKKGLLGVAVGAEYPAGAQAHLVEDGHEITSHGQPTGRLTRPLKFQRTAEKITEAVILSKQIAAIKKALASAEAKAAKT